MSISITGGLNLYSREPDRRHDLERAVRVEHQFDIRAGLRRAPCTRRTQLTTEKPSRRTTRIVEVSHSWRY